MTGTTLPTFFISHGGGPWPWMKEEMQGRYDRLAEALRRMPGLVGTRPNAVLMVSAHWEEENFTTMAHPHPPMVYDYYGFPDYTYQIHYDAPGDPALASQAKSLIEAAGLPARLEPERGFDHGAFTPLKVTNARSSTVERAAVIA